MDDYKPNLAEENENKLTKWAKEPTVRQLKMDVEAAKPSHNAQVQRIQKWNDLSQVKGSAKPKKVPGRSSVQPKLIRRQAEWRYSALSEPFLGSNKVYTISPVTWEDTKGAQQAELVINYQFRTKLNRVKFIDDLVRSTVDDGTSIVRTGWKRTTVKVKELAPVYAYYPIERSQELEVFQQALEASQANPREFDEKAPPELKEAIKYFKETGQPTIVTKTGDQEVDVEKLVENYPTAEVKNPENIIIDPSCNGVIDKALFVVEMFETNKADLQKEGRYKNLELVDWQGNTAITTPDYATTTPSDFAFNDSIRKKVVAFEYWGYFDIEGDGVLVPIVATWIGSVMIRLERNPYPDQKIPYVVIPYLPVKRDLYGEADAELLEDNQNILGALMRGMVDLLGRSANSQQGFAKGMLDPLNRRRFDNGQDYEFNPNNNPTTNHIEHKYPELPASAIQMLTLQNQDAESLTGVKSFSGGISGEAYGDVAAGIRGVLDAASKREMAILRRLAQGMKEIGTKINSMNGAFLSEQEVVRVTNTEFVTVNRDDLMGNFDMEVDISTAEVDNQKSQDLAFMLQTIGPKGDPAITYKILSEICRLKRMPDLAHDLANYKPQPDPIVEALKQEELKKAQLENEKLMSEIRLNDAKAEEVRANKAQKDLDYVEQETGTKHARELEKDQAQSEGNQRLEVTKSILKPVKQDEKKPDITAAIGYNQLSASGQLDAPQSTIARDELAGVNPQLNLGSGYFNPSQDPALNPNLNIA